MGVSIYPFGFEPPGVPSTRANGSPTPDSTYLAANKYSVASVKIEDYPEGNAMCGIHISVTNTFRMGDSLKVWVNIVEDSTDQILNTKFLEVPQPSSGGVEFWQNYNLYFWAHRAQWEIYRAMKVRFEVRITGKIGSMSVNANKLHYIDVKQEVWIPPDDDDPVPDHVRKGKRVEFYFKDISGFMSKMPFSGFIGGGVSKLVAQKAELIEKVNGFLPEGWQINEIIIENNKLSIEFEDLHSLILLIILLVQLLWPYLVAFGLIITSWKVFDWLKAKETTKQETEDTEQTDKLTGLAEKLAELGYSPEEIANIISVIDKTTGGEETPWWESIGKTLIWVTVGVGVIILGTLMLKNQK